MVDDPHRSRIRHITHGQLLRALDALGLPHDVIEVHIGNETAADDAYVHHHDHTWRARVVRSPKTVDDVTTYEVSYVPISLRDDVAEEHG